MAATPQNKALRSELLRPSWESPKVGNQLQSLQAITIVLLSKRKLLSCSWLQVLMELRMFVPTASVDVSPTTTTEPATVTGLVLPHVYVHTLHRLPLNYTHMACAWSRNQFNYQNGKHHTFIVLCMIIWLISWANFGQFLDSNPVLIIGNFF